MGEAPLWPSRGLGLATATPGLPSGPRRPHHQGLVQRELAKELTGASEEPLNELPNLTRRSRRHETGEHWPDALYTQLNCKAFGLTEYKHVTPSIAPALMSAML